MKNFSKRLISFTLSLILIISSGVAQVLAEQIEPAEGSYSFTIVLKSDNGSFISGASVTFDGKTILTDESGCAVFTHSSLTTYSYSVSAKGYQGYSGVINLINDKHTLVLTLPERCVIATIAVYTGGLPLKDAIVSIDGQTQLTGSDGRSYFTLPGYSSYTYTAAKAGYKTLSGSISVLDTDIDKTVDIKLDNITATINVTFGSTPLPGAIVTLNGISVTSDSSGNARFTVPAHNSYSYTAKKPGYKNATGNITLSSEPISKNVSLAKEDIPVTIKILSGDSKLSGAAVSLNGQTKTTDKEGSVIFNVPSFGSYSYSAGLQGYDQAKGSIAVESSPVIKNVYLTEKTLQLPFTDVPEKIWYRSAVEYAFQKGLFAGTSATTFSPNSTMTRSMAVQVLYNLEGKPAVTGKQFSDVPSGSWYYDAVLWASKNGIVSGIGNNRFAPNSNVTREQMAVIVCNYCKHKSIELPVLRDMISFSDDSKISRWARNPITLIYQANIMSGKGSNRLDPGGNATRAEVAQIFKNFLEATK